MRFQVNRPRSPESLRMELKGSVLFGWIGGYYRPWIILLSGQSSSFCCFSFPVCVSGFVKGGELQHNKWKQPHSEKLYSIIFAFGFSTVDYILENKMSELQHLTSIAF